MNPQSEANIPRGANPSSRWRPAIALGAACVVAATGAQWLATTSVTTAAMTPVDPEVALLLRGMAFVKALLVAAVLVAAWWRSGWPMTARTEWGYRVGVAAMVAATVLIAHLAWIVPAAIGFHAGALAVMIVAWRDDGLLRDVGRRAASREVARPVSLQERKGRATPFCPSLSRGAIHAR